MQGFDEKKCVFYVGDEINFKMAWALHRASAASGDQCFRGVSLISRRRDHFLGASRMSRLSVPVHGEFFIKQANKPS